MPMSPRQAIDFIRRHGVVLEAARGLEPSLAERVAGAPISGSWWSHPLGHDIYALTQFVAQSKAVLVCTLARRRTTYVHRRLWASFVRLGDFFPPHALDQVREIHLPSGRHQRQDVPFPVWVPAAVLESAAALSIEAATVQIQPWLLRYGLNQGAAR